MIAVKLKKLWKPAEIFHKIMFIVFWPITTKLTTCMQATKPQTKLWLLFELWITYPWLTFSLQHNNIPEIFLVFTIFWIWQ